ncbi:MAG: hypothetical protein ABR519_10905, partial [Bacteroidales bacterium]
LKDYFAGIVPEYDRDRVYVSDIKKLISWYNILQKLNLLTQEEESGAAPEGEEVPSAPESDQNHIKEEESGA